MLDTLTVFDAAENISGYLSNKLDGACPIISCRQKQEALEGGGYADVLEFSIPATHEDASLCMEGAFVGFPDQDSSSIFQMYQIVKELHQYGDGSPIPPNIKLFHCEHAFYETRDEHIDDVRPTNTTAGAAISAILAAANEGEGSRWELGTAADLGTASVRVYHESVLSGLCKIAAAWGGELQFRLHVTGGVIDHRYVDILKQRGTDTGKRYLKGKDLIQFIMTTDRTNLCTRVYPRGRGEEVSTDENGVNYGRRLTIANVVWSTANGDPCDKPAGQEYVEDAAALALYGRASGTRHISREVNFDDCDDANELIQRGYDYLQANKAPHNTYALTVVDLEGLGAGYEHEAVRFGDTNHIIEPVPEVSEGVVRVIALDRNLLDGRDCNITLGDYLPALDNGLITLQKQQAVIQERRAVYDRATAINANPTGGGTLAWALDLLKVQLISTASHFYTDANGNYIWESADGTKALKLGGGILALANSKTAGEFNWTTFATGDGITATAVLAATGTFISLITGEIDGAHMFQGVGEGGLPGIWMYGDNGRDIVSSWTPLTGFKFGTAKIGPHSDAVSSGLAIWAT